MPARPGSRRRPAAPLQQRALAWIKALPDHPLLDRIVRGRTWIVLLGVLLAGIVAMQVEMLKLNSSIGRSIELGTALQSRNELLRASVSSLSDSARIERLASKMGMVMPGPTSVGFLEAGKVNAGQAAANIQAPDPSSFESMLQTTGSSQITPLGSDSNGALMASPTGTAPGSTAAGATAGTTSTGTTATGTVGTAATGAIGVGSTGTATGTSGTTAGTTGAVTGAAGAATGAMRATGATGTSGATGTGPATGTGAGAGGTATGAGAAATGGTTLQTTGG